MAVTRFNYGSAFTNLVKSDSFLDGNTAYDPAATWLIQRQTVGAGGAASITFSSIPSTYKHLQIRMITRNTSTGSLVYAQFNGDTATNYSYHSLFGDGASPSAAGGATQAQLRVNQNPISTSLANTFAAGVTDILDYTNTSKNKTIRTMTGLDMNGSGSIYLYSGAWFNTAAVTSILVYPAANTFAQYSTFALYGILG